jgi:hypothetical protein
MPSSVLTAVASSARRGIRAPHRCRRTLRSISAPSIYSPRTTGWRRMPESPTRFPHPASPAGRASGCGIPRFGSAPSANGGWATSRTPTSPTSASMSSTTSAIAVASRSAPRPAPVDDSQRCRSTSCWPSSAATGWSSSDVIGSSLHTEWFEQHDALERHLEQLSAGVDDPWTRYALWKSEAAARESPR